MMEAITQRADRKLGPHVTAYTTDAYPLVNSAIVRGTDATLVFDTAVLRYAKELRKAVDESGPPLRDAVLSHGHYDHAHGAMHFAPPARLWARRFTRDRLAYWSTRDLGPIADGLKSKNADLASAYGEVRIVVPEEVVERETVIELGGAVRVVLYPEGIAHTAGDLWAMVEPDNIVLCGDLWFNGYEPYLGDGSVAGSLAALRHMRSARARGYLPGHGPTDLIGPEDSDMMSRYCIWLEEHTAEGVARGLRGESLSAAVRAEYSAQRNRADGVRFRYEYAGFLEEGVQAAEKAHFSPSE